MERNLTHTVDATAKLPVRQKEVKFDSLFATPDERFSETVSNKFEERRGFRPSFKVFAASGPRPRVRAGANAELGFIESLPILTDASTVAAEEKVMPIPRTKARQLRMSEGAVNGAFSARGRTRETMARVVAVPSSSTIPSMRNLWVEGSSVLNPDVGHASVALSHLSDCVAEERRLKKECDAARLAKLSALRTVVRVFMNSFTDQGPEPQQNNISSKIFSDTLAVARCSVVTNALVGTVQNFLRSLHSRQLCAARGPMTIPPRLPYSATQHNERLTASLCSSLPSKIDFFVEHPQFSASNSGSDPLELEEISRLKQLYFDYFDCEAVSITSAMHSGSDGSMLDCRGSPALSRPSSSASQEEEECSFSQFASKTF